MFAMFARELIICMAYQFQELPPKGNTLAAAAGLIMEFEGE
jgi:hypothetical protein